MTSDPQINAYLQRVRSSVLAPKQQRRRILDDIAHHLDDSAAEHMRHGATRTEAIALAIDKLGPPETVAAGFNQEHHPDETAGAALWLPLLLPLLLLISALGASAWILAAMFTNGWSNGGRVALTSTLPIVALAAAMSYAAYFCITRARHDRAWRKGAWLCAAAAVIVAIAPYSLR